MIAFEKAYGDILVRCTLNDNQFVTKYLLSVGRYATHATDYNYCMRWLVGQPLAVTREQAEDFIAESPLGELFLVQAIQKGNP